MTALQKSVSDIFICCIAFVHCLQHMRLAKLVASAAEVAVGSVELGHLQILIETSSMMHLQLS